MEQFIDKKIKIGTSEVEGECNIIDIQSFRISEQKKIISYILILLTGGILFLCSNWSLKLRLKLFYSICGIQEATHYLITNSDQQQCLVEKKIMPDQQIYFENRFIKYFYNQDENSFIALDTPFFKQQIDNIIQQIQNQEKNNIFNELYFGKCKQIIPIPNARDIIIQEIIKPYFIIQYIAVIAYCAQGVYEGPLIMLFFSFYFTYLNCQLTIKSYFKLKESNEINIQIQKINNSNFDEDPQNILSEQLLPGDLFVIEKGMKLPCDCISINGEIIVNEDSLTGESVPIPKYNLQQSKDIFNVKKHRRNILFEGTTVLQVKNTDNNKYVIALVIRTGYLTSKGQILRSILYPKPIDFPFYRQSFIFLLILGLFVLIAFIFQIIMMINSDFTSLSIFIRSINVLLQIFPPAMPVLVAKCLGSGLRYLRIRNVTTLNPEKILIAAKINCMCFDKTGTITSNQISIQGFSTQQNIWQLKSPNDITEEIKTQDLNFKIYASCHQLCKIDDNIIGEELEKSMLELSGWQLQNSVNPAILKFVRYQQHIINIVKLFEFTPNLQRMSVITTDQNNQIYYFSKGSPESIINLCEIDEETKLIFQNTLNQLTSSGARIICMAYKQLNQNQINQNREQLDNQLIFTGFLVLQNSLKSDSSDVIQKLRNAEIKCKIISGDNPMTTISTAIKANIMNDKQDILLIDQKENFIKFIPFQNNKNKQVYDFQLGQQLYQQFDKLKSTGNYQFAITGYALDCLISNSDVFQVYRQTLQKLNNENSRQNNNNIQQNSSNSEQDIEQSINLQINEQQMYEILQTCLVFARMRPEQKQIIVEILQKTGQKVGFIGDGANDCAAIKQSDMGISFIDCDASFSAPFQTNQQSIEVVYNIIKLGKSQLQIVIEIFRLYVITNVLSFTNGFILIKYFEEFGGWENFYQSFLIVMILFFQAFSQPNDELNTYQVNDKFLSLYSFLQIYGQIVLGSLSYLGIYDYWYQQNWSNTNEFPIINSKNQGLYSNGQLAAVIFCGGNIFTLILFIAMYNSYPFKQKLVKNKYLMIVLLVYIIFSVLFLLVPSLGDSWIFYNTNEKYSIIKHNNFLLELLLISIGCGIIMMIYQMVLKKIFKV